MRMRKLRMTRPAASDTTVMPAEPEPTQGQLKAIASESHKELRGRAWLSLNPSTAGAAKMTIGQLEQFAMGHFDPNSLHSSGSCKFNSISGTNGREHFWKRGCRDRTGGYRHSSA